jgi:perosamine synthetase
MPIFTSSTPTIEEDDLKIVRNFLRHKSTKKSELTLPGFDGRKHFFTNTGRASLYLLLQSLDLSEGDEVVIQSFTCVALVIPLLWLKVKPVYADIELKTYNMSLESLKAKINSKTRAVIVQHTFGIPSQIKKIKDHIDELNREREEGNRIYLIEDCAHALNVKVDDKYLGSFGDVSFFSFGQDKVVSCTQGGCAICNNKELEERLEKIYKDIPNMPESMVKYNLRYPLLWNIIKKYYFKPKFLAFSKRFSKFTIGKFLILLFRFFGLIKQQASKNDFGSPESDVYKLSDKQKILLKNQLDKTDRFSKHREEIVSKYSRLLGLNLKGSLIRYPITVKDSFKVKSELQSIGVIAGNWYDYPVIPRGIDLSKVKYHLGSCPNTEYVMEHIINLPTGINVTEKEVERVVKVVKDSLL